MYVCMYVCMYVYTYIHIYACMLVCECMHICIHIHIHTNIHTSIYSCMPWDNMYLESPHGIPMIRLCAPARRTGILNIPAHLRRCSLQSTSSDLGGNGPEVQFPAGAAMSLVLSPVINIEVNNGWFNAFFKVDSVVKLSVEFSAPWCQAHGSSQAGGVASSDLHAFSENRSAKAPSRRAQNTGGLSNKQKSPNLGVSSRQVAQRLGHVAMPADPVLLSQLVHLQGSWSRVPVEAQEFARQIEGTQRSKASGHIVVTKLRGNAVVNLDDKENVVHEIAFKAPEAEAVEESHRSAVRQAKDSRSQRVNLDSRSRNVGISVSLDARIHTWASVDLGITISDSEVSLQSAAVNPSTSVGSHGESAIQGPVCIYSLCFESSDVSNGHVINIAQRPAGHGKGTTLNLGSLVRL
jgi:hypothetical protein